MTGPEAPLHRLTSVRQARARDRQCVGGEDPRDRGVDFVIATERTPRRARSITVPCFRHCCRVRRCHHSRDHVWDQKARKRGHRRWSRFCPSATFRRQSLARPRHRRKKRFRLCSSSPCWPHLMGLKPSVRSLAADACSIAGRPVRRARVEIHADATSESSYGWHLDCRSRPCWHTHALCHRRNASLLRVRRLHV